MPLVILPFIPLLQVPGNLTAVRACQGQGLSVLGDLHVLFTCFKCNNSAQAHRVVSKDVVERVLACFKSFAKVKIRYMRDQT